jgi:hypothetical protein
MRSCLMLKRSVLCRARLTPTFDGLKVVVGPSRHQLGRSLR